MTQVWKTYEAYIGCKHNHISHTCSYFLMVLVLCLAMSLLATHGFKLCRCW